MYHQDEFIPAFVEVQDLLWAARPDQLFEAMRLLACEVAYFARYHETLPLPELDARIQAANVDPAALQIVTDAMVHLAEIFARLNVKPVAGVARPSEWEVVGATDS